MRIDPVLLNVNPSKLRRALLGIAVLGGVVVIATACRSTTTPQAFTRAQLDGARSELGRPLPGNLAALYRLRVPSSGGLRLSILTVADEGRVTISEPFGSAVSLTAWSGTTPPTVFDLQQGCRFVTDDVSGVLGVGSLPLPQAVRLLGGRLPTVEGDRVEILEDGRLRVEGDRWHGLVVLDDDPWRVTAVEDLSAGEGRGWRARLRDHTSSLPGWLRVTGVEGRWAELELVRLEWDSVDELPEVPDVPWCPRPSSQQGGKAGPSSDGDS